MDVVSFRASQLYSSSVRLLASTFASSQSQQQQQLIAFCTLLTVALSVLLLSFKQSRLLIISTTSTTLYYSSLNVTHCLKCLRSSVHRSKLNLRYYNYNNAASASFKYLKLKRLGKSLAAALTQRSTYTNYLLKPLNRTFTTMRKQTNKLRVKNIINIKSVLKLNNGQKSRRVGGGSTQSLSAYCSACDQSAINANNGELKANGGPMATSQSYPMFKPKLFVHEEQSEHGLHRSYTEPRINRSKIQLYRKLPLRSMSRAWGEINSIELPVWSRKPCYYFYSWMFSCNLEEIDIDDITQFKNLSEFFRRALKPDARTIDTDTCLVSPCDGKILHFGQVDKGMLEQVKGVNYSLQAFLGEQNWPKNNHDNNNNNKSNNSIHISLNSSNRSSFSSDSGLSDISEVSTEEHYEKSILYNPDNCLYHCVIYLAPGDYHRFHSPADWQIFSRRHFPGELFSVNPSVARWLQGLFSFNERVVYYGEWEHGFFSMTAVGATNVGSIRVYMDDDLTTNNKPKDLKVDDLEKSFCKKSSENNLKGVEFKKGDSFGEFNLGSTIVLIFEAPKDFKFKINQNEKVLYGCQLGCSSSSSEVDEHTHL